MKYLLGTDTLIDFSKDYEPVVTKLRGILEQGDTLAICAITVAEFYSGLPDKPRTRWDAFFSTLEYWSLTAEAARQAGIDRNTAARSGKALAITDALIAAVAAEHHATILTSNIKDYPTSGTKVLSLRGEAA